LIRPIETETFDTLYIFGAGGSGREISWLARTIWPDTRQIFLVDDLKYVRPSVNGIPVRLLGDTAINKDARFVVALGDPAARERAVALCMASGVSAVSLVHPRAEISSWVELGEGSVVCAGAVITTNVKVGAHVHINVGCTVSHDTFLDDFTTLSPGVHIAGHVRVGKRAFFGIGATVINGRLEEPLSIGNDALIAAGACVIDTVPASAMVAGVPAVSKR
jgi:sugar O-acyltransferase (sialic acid O-acetyltransferase NeuD family)